MALAKYWFSFILKQARDLANLQILNMTIIHDMKLRRYDGPQQYPFLSFATGNIFSNKGRQKVFMAWTSSKWWI